MKPAIVSVAWALIATIGALAWAQDSVPRNGSRPNRIPTYGFIPAGNAVEPLPNHPFSAVVVQRMEQTLNDGTTISRENREVVMRDGMGRLYRAREIKPLNRPTADPRVIITIFDPVRRVQYFCTPMRSCRKTKFHLYKPGPQPHFRPGKDKASPPKTLGPRR
jgi:hypothetical protein